MQWTVGRRRRRRRTQLTNRMYCGWHADRTGLDMMGCGCGLAQDAAGVNCPIGQCRAGRVRTRWMCAVLGEASCMTSRRVTLPRAMNQCSNPRLTPKSGPLCRDCPLICCRRGPARMSLDAARDGVGICGVFSRTWQFLLLSAYDPSHAPQVGS